MLFFEVFDNLQLGADLTKLFEEVEVERVVASRSHSRIRIYIKSKRLITYRNLRMMEYQMKKQLFTEQGTSCINEICFQQRYELSASYTPEKLLPIYFDSMLDEFREESVLDAALLKNARFEFEGDKMMVALEDNFVIKERSSRFRDKLLEIFNERCGFSVQISFIYYEVNRKEEEEPVFVMPVKLKSSESEGTTQVNPSKEKNPDKKGKETKSAEKKVGSVQEKKNTEPVKTEKSFDSGSGYNKTFENGKRNFRKLPDDPDIFFGRTFDGEIVPIADIQDEIGEVVIHGKVLSVEPRELRNEKTIVTFSITDFTDTIAGKVFLKNEQVGELLGKLKKGTFIKLKGMALLDRYDREVGISSIVGIKTIPDFTVSRKDNSTKKRVELHAHTLMSDMDAVVDPKTLVKRAKSWGMPAIAITDHGVVQAFPDASHALDKGDDFKIIYGCEIYLVDDVKNIVENAKGQTIKAPCVVFDIETTGFGPAKDKIIEIGAVKVVDGKIVDKYSTFINPEVPIPFEIEKLTGITDEMVLPAPTIDKVLPEFLENTSFVNHN